MAGKQDIRQQLIAKRNEISLLEWQEMTDAITASVTQLPSFREAFELYCYVDFNNEVGTASIMEEAWRLGKRVAVPKVSGNRIDFYYIRSVEDLETGTFGIKEPVTSEKADGTDGLILMPGIAFDWQRNRIGYGKGYYDRYLYGHPQMTTAAIAFDMQMMDSIPAQSHDIRPQIIITEKERID